MILRLKPFASILLIALPITISCSKEKFEDTIKRAKAKTQAFTDTSSSAAEQRSIGAGSITLGTSPTCQVDQAYISVIAIGDGRPNVVQIASYDVNQEITEYPSVLIHGLTKAENVSTLAGETVPCDLYFQKSPDGPIAMTKPGESVNVVFGSTTHSGDGISATVESTELLSADDQVVPMTGGQVLAIDPMGAW